MKEIIVGAVIAACIVGVGYYVFNPPLQDFNVPQSHIGGPVTERFNYVPGSMLCSVGPGPNWDELQMMLRDTMGPGMVLNIR